MNPPRVSIVLPVYNSEKTLAQAIRSLLRQSFRDFELIIVEDPSTDDSPRIVDSFTDERIVVLRSEAKLGLVGSLNRGLEAARGEYIARMDADDISLPWRLELEVKALDRDPELGVVGGQIIKFKPNGLFKLTALPRLDQQIKSFFLFSTCFAHPSVMIRRSVLVDNKIAYDKDFKDAEDYKIWVDLMDKTKMRILGAPVLLYRLSGENLTARISANKQASDAQDDKMRIVMRIAYTKHGLAYESEVAEAALNPDTVDSVELLKKLKARFGYLGAATGGRSVMRKKFNFILRRSSLPTWAKILYRSWSL